MVDVCVPIDIACCLCAQYERREGNEEPQGCCKKFWLPITSVVDATGYDNYSDIALAYFLGFFYTLFCWDETGSNTTRFSTRRFDLLESPMGEEKV